MSDEYDVTIAAGYRTPGRRLNQWAATWAPEGEDDETLGYGVGSMWIDQSAKTVYICFDATAGSAIWFLLTAVQFTVGQWWSEAAPVTASFTGTST